MSNNPNDTQVGGDHYKKATFQPWDWELHGAGGWQQAVIKYVVRYRDKNGLQDLGKAQHYLDKIAFHHKKDYTYNRCGASLTLIENFCEQNMCNNTQRRAIELTLLWRDDNDIQAAKKQIELLMADLRNSESIF